MLKIETTELKNIISRCESLGGTEENQSGEMTLDLVQMSIALDNICKIVLSTELRLANDRVAKALDDILSKLKNGIPEVTSFLKRQVGAYEEADERAREQLEALVYQVNATFNNN